MDTCWQILLQLWTQRRVNLLPDISDTRSLKTEASKPEVSEHIQQLFQPAQLSEDNKIILEGPKACQVLWWDYLFCTIQTYYPHAAVACLYRPAGQISKH